jgi:hypothetical protein
MSDKTFVFAADRHGREADVEGDIYIGAGDEIYTEAADDDAEDLADYTTGLKGEAEDAEELAEYLTGAYDEVFSDLSEKYEEAHIGLGNHEFQRIQEAAEELGVNAVHFAERVAENYDNVEIHVDDLVEIDGRNFYFDRPFESNNPVELMSQGDLPAVGAGYEEDELEAAAGYLDKEASEVTCSDIDSILEGEEEDTEESDSGFSIRGFLEDLPVIGKYVEKAYSIAGKYLGSEEAEEDAAELPEIERTEAHEQIREQVPQYEEMIEDAVERIDGAEGEVTYIAHGQPQTEENQNGSIRTRDILEKAGNIGATYTGHFHGELEEEIAGARVINPGEGYTHDESGGALEEDMYDTHQFEGDRVAEADPMEIEQPEQELSDEQKEKAQEIIREVQEEAESEEEAQQLFQQGLQEEGISA